MAIHPLITTDQTAILKNTFGMERLFDRSVMHWCFGEEHGRHILMLPAQATYPGSSARAISTPEWRVVLRLFDWEEMERGVWVEEFDGDYEQFEKDCLLMQMVNG